MAYIKLLDSELQKFKNIYARNILYVFVTLIYQRKGIRCIFHIKCIFLIHYFSLTLSDSHCIAYQVNLFRQTIWSHDMFNNDIRIEEGMSSTFHQCDVLMQIDEFSV